MGTSPTQGRASVWRAGESLWTERTEPGDVDLFDYLQLQIGIVASIQTDPSIALGVAGAPPRYGEVLCVCV